MNADLKLLGARDRACLVPQGISEPSSGLMAMSELFHNPPHPHFPYLSQGVLNTRLVGSTDYRAWHTADPSTRPPPFFLKVPVFDVQSWHKPWPKVVPPSTLKKKNPNYNEILLYTHEEGYYPKQNKARTKRRQAAGIGEDVEKLEPWVHCWRDGRRCACWRTERPYDPAIPRPGIYRDVETCWKGTGGRDLNSYVCIRVHSRVVPNSQKEKAPRLPADGRLNEQTIVYADNGIFFPLKKAGHPAVCCDTGGP